MVEDSIGMKEHLPMSVRVVVEILVAKPFDKGSQSVLFVPTLVYGALRTNSERI